MEKISIQFLDNLKFAADCAIKDPDSIYAQEFFMLLDETFGKREDYEQPVQAVAVSWLIGRVKEMEQRAEAAEAKLVEREGFEQEPVAILGQQLRGYAEPTFICYLLIEEHNGEVEAGSPLFAEPNFTSPAPAVSLAELVPDEEAFVTLIKERGMSDIKRDGHYIALETRCAFRWWMFCRAAILRKIEEAK